MLTQLNWKKSLGNKKYHKDEEAKKRGEVRKRMTQYLLFCANRLKTPADVQEMIKSDVRPQYAGLGCTSVENNLSKQFGEDDNIFF